MNHTLGAVQCRLEGYPGSKINTGTPACEVTLAPRASSLRTTSVPGSPLPPVTTILIRENSGPDAAPIGKEDTMAVAGREKVLGKFRELINGEVKAGTILCDPYLPTDLEPRSDDPVRMDPSTLIGGTATRRATRSTPSRRPGALSLTDRRKCCPAGR
jgi:hypothetical protein